jgi:hypothetical protein
MMRAPNYPQEGLPKLAFLPSYRRELSTGRNILPRSARGPPTARQRTPTPYGNPLPIETTAKPTAGMPGFLMTTIQRRDPRKSRLREHVLLAKLARELEKKLGIVPEAQELENEFPQELVPRCLSGAAGPAELCPISRPHGDATWLTPNSRGRENHPRSRDRDHAVAMPCYFALSRVFAIQPVFCAASLDSTFDGSFTHSAGRTGSLAKAMENTPLRSNRMLGVGRYCVPIVSPDLRDARSGGR